MGFKNFKRPKKFSEDRLSYNGRLIASVFKIKKSVVISEKFEEAALRGWVEIEGQKYGAVM